MSKEGKDAIVRSSAGMSVATLLSRLLGLVRVRLEAAVLGGGIWASAWFLAFMLPNLFRRVLGEGAVGTALMPLVAETESKEGKAAVRRKLTVVFTVLGGILLLIVLICTGASVWALHGIPAGSSGFFGKDYVRLALKLLPLLMPYAFFICLAGVIGAVLNYARIFMLPALAALLLNVVLLTGQIVVLCRNMPLTEALPLLAVMVPVAGVLHLGVLLWLLKRCGMFPEFSLEAFKDCRILGELWHLALPGILSFSALQVSFLADRFFAASLGAQAVPALTYVDRIVDLPVGVVAVSLGTVLMSGMSRAAASGDHPEISRMLIYGLRLIWFVCLPLAVMVIFCHEPMLRLLCLGGRYSESDLAAAKLVAIFYGMGIPLFCSLKVILPAFHARKKMRTTLYVSLVAIGCNILLNLILMRYLRQGGIALATTLASLLNNSVLLILLAREGLVREYGALIKSLLRSLVISVTVGGGLYWLYAKNLRSWAQRNFINEFSALALTGMAMLLLFGVISWLCGSREIKELLPVLGRFKSRK